MTDIPIHKTELQQHSSEIYEMQLIKHSNIFFSSFNSFFVFKQNLHYYWKSYENFNWTWKQNLQHTYPKRHVKCQEEVAFSVVS